MTEIEKLAGQVALLQLQVRRLTAQVEQPAKLPEYFVKMATAIAEVEDVARAIGVVPERAWHAGPRRAEIMRALRARGWSISRVSQVLSVSRSAVLKAAKG